MRIHSLALMGLLGVVSASPAQAAIPGQFIAKMYTEALGRAPDASGWQVYTGNFARDGCSWATLKANGRAIYLSAEYAGLGYDNTEKVLTAYRGILSREPEAAGFQSGKAMLDQGGSFQSLVDSFFDSSEFRGLVPAICAGGSYGWRSAAVMALPTAGSGFAGGTGAQLQALLNAAAPGTTVYLAPRAVVYADGEIIVPAGVTLATTGLPHQQQYARMARIVRNTLFSADIVRLESGARLLSVWVSGQRQQVGFTGAAANIFMRGTGGAMRNSRSDSPAGWTTLRVTGLGDYGIACSNITVSDNLLTGYTSHHTTAEGGGWADGISISCEGATVTGNDIVDATDVGIILFRAYPAVQASLVTNNIIVAAGLSSYAALAVDPTEGPQPSFAGSLMSGNQFWASPSTHFDIGIAVGTRAWGFTSPAVGTGASVRDNTTAGIATNMDSGIFINGMLNATVQGNLLVRTPLEVSRCPSGNVLADVAGGYASGNFQSWAQASALNCIGH